MQANATSYTVVGLMNERITSQTVPWHCTALRKPRKLLKHTPHVPVARSFIFFKECSLIVAPEKRTEFTKQMQYLAVPASLSPEGRGFVLSSRTPGPSSSKAVCCETLGVNTSCPRHSSLTRRKHLLCTAYWHSARAEQAVEGRLI